MQTQTKAKPPRRLQRLRRQLKIHGITQLQVAAAAEVSPVHVCNVLAGRDTSRKVIEAAARLIAAKAETMLPAEKAS